MFPTDMKNAISRLSTPDYYEYSGRIRALLEMLLENSIDKEYARQRLNEIDAEIEAKQNG